MSEKSDAPLVTIGLTCFNARETILRALQSASGQDWPALEVVVVDDRSTDGSVGIVRSYLATDSRVRLVEHLENLGVAAARNTILAHARGEFIAFFDDDDESLPNRVREQVRALTTHETATGARLVACFAGGEQLYPNGYRVAAPAIGVEGPAPHGPAVADYLLFYGRQRGWFYGSGPGAGMMLARRETFDAIGRFDPDFRRLEDVEFAVRLALAGGHFVGTEEKLYLRLMTDGAEKSAEIIRDAHIAIARKHHGYLRRVGRCGYAQRWPWLRYWHFKRRYDRFALELLALLARNPIAATSHLLATGPARLILERNMRRSGVAGR